jgi:hypothetical protein
MTAETLTPEQRYRLGRMRQAGRTLSQAAGRSGFPAELIEEVWLEQEETELRAARGRRRKEFDRADRKFRDLITAAARGRQDQTR